MTLEPGQIVDGKYRIVRMLGQGGMGAVYEGENARIHRKVAIKVLHAGVAAKADVVERFEREAQAAGRIGSEHIVEVLDLGSLPQGERYMVMEFLEGESLGDRIKKRRRLEPRELAPIAHQLLEGLAAAHDAGIIHRDLKPDNVYLLTSKGGQRDFVKVLDFGVSKFSALEADSLSMTKTGAVMGTPYYMSPEQARGAKIDPRSDLYSVGVVLYQAVTGRVPFNAETFNELVFKIALESPHPAELVTPGLDPAFATIVAKSMMRDASARFQSSREFQQALAHWIRTGGAPSNGPYEARSGGGTMALPQMSMPMGGAPQGMQQQGMQQQGMQQGMPQGMQPQGFGGPQGYPPAPQGMQQGMPQGMQQQGFGGNTPQQGMPQQGMPQAGFGGNTPQQGMQSQALGSSGNQFGAAGMVQSSPQLGASHAGLAMTAPQPRSNGMMIAIGLVGTLLVAGGGFGAYKVLGARASAGSGTVEPQSMPTTPPTPLPVAPTASETAATPPTAPPTTTTEAPPSSVEPSDPPVPTGKQATNTPPTRTTGRTTPPVPGAGTGGKKTPTTPTTTPTAKTTGTTKGPGRVIGGEL